MSNPTPELFPERPVRSDFAKRQRLTLGRLRRVIVLLAALIVLGGGAWALSAIFGGEDEAQTEIPTIQAEGPVKQRPEQPGGIDIPHQDEQVFQQLDKNSSERQPEVEHLLPPPEAPKESAATAPPVEPAPPAPVTKEEALSAAPAQPVEGGIVTQETTPAEPPKEVEKAEKAPKAVTSAKKETPPKPSSKSMVVGSIPKELFTGQPPKTYLVQLGSYPDMTLAQKEMKKTQTKFASSLGKVSLKLTKADLGSKGIYYRVQSEPLSDEQARAICAELWARKAPCIVVRQ